VTHFIGFNFTNLLLMLLYYNLNITTLQDALCLNIFCINPRNVERNLKWICMLLNCEERTRLSSCGVGSFEFVAVVDCVHNSERQWWLLANSILAFIMILSFVFHSRSSPRNVYTYLTYVVGIYFETKRNRKWSVQWAQNRCCEE
jgi:hypothetical protein